MDIPFAMFTSTQPTGHINMKKCGNTSVSMYSSYDNIKCVSCMISSFNLTFLYLFDQIKTTDNDLVKKDTGQVLIDTADGSMCYKCADYLYELMC
jgi:hypothetical protein